MSNLATLVSVLQQKTKRDGAEAEAIQKNAINWAIHDINKTAISLFLKTGSDIQTQSGVYLYSLPSDFLMPYSFLLYYTTTDWYSLAEAENPAEIIGCKTNSKPYKYYLYGFSGNARQILIGANTPNGVYTVKPIYYQRLPDLTQDSDESIISIVYNDDPIIYGALYKTWLDFENPNKAQQAFFDYQKERKNMVSIMGYSRGEYAKPDY